MPNISKIITSDGTSQQTYDIMDEQLTLKVNNLELLNLVTPEQFGCVGDGVTDDTVNFQNAINYVQTNKTKILWLTRDYLLTNISITDYCKIYFNNRKLIPSQTGTGIFLDINIPYQHGGTIEDNPFFRTEIFKDIYIKCGHASNYTYMMSIKVRNGIFNSIEIAESWSNALYVGEYDGVVIDYLRLGGGDDTGVQNKIGLYLDREDCYFKTVEINGFNTNIVITPNIDTQFNHIHIWGGLTGIRFLNGVGGSFDSTIFDSLTTCIDVQSNNYGSGCAFTNIQMINCTYLFNTQFKNQLMNLSISSIKGLNNISMLNSDGSDTFSGKMYNANNIPMTFTASLTNYPYSVSFRNVNGCLTLPPYINMQVTYVNGEYNLGKLNPSTLNFYATNCNIGVIVTSSGDGIVYINANGEMIFKLRNTAISESYQTYPYISLPLCNLN